MVCIERQEKISPLWTAMVALIFDVRLCGAGGGVATY
jgi:hypothetical protein